MKKPKPQADLPTPPETDTQRAFGLYERLAPLMAGQGAPIQGNVIAMLLGTFLWGHRVMNGDGSLNVEATRDIRGRMMVLQTKAAFAYAADRDQSSKEAEDEPRKPKGTN